MTLALMHLCIETHRSPFLLILVGSASYMTLQTFPHKELAYSILDLCIETHLSPFLLILVGSASYMTLQTFLHKELAYSILVWLTGSLFHSFPLPSGYGHPVSSGSGTHSLHRKSSVRIPARRRLRALQNSYT